MDGSAKVQSKIKSIVIGGGFGGIARALKVKSSWPSSYVIREIKLSRRSGTSF